MKPASVTEPGYKSFTPPGWTGHGSLIDTSGRLERILNCFWIDKKNFQENVDYFIQQCLPEDCKSHFSSAMWLAGEILYHICKQEVPNIYETIIALGKKLCANERLTPEQRVAQIYAKIRLLLQNTKETKDFFEKVKQVVPHCRWSRENEPLESVIYTLIDDEEEENWKRRHPPGD